MVLILKAFNLKSDIFLCHSSVRLPVHIILNDVELRAASGTLLKC